MNRDAVLGLVRAHKATLAERFGVIELRLYGSFARDQAEGDSDVDVLVRFDAPPDWKRYFGAQAAGAAGGDTPLRGTRGH